MTLPDEALGRDEDTAGEEARQAGEPVGPAELDLEAPEADAVEQATPAGPAEVQAEITRDPEVNEYDAVEQARVVQFDDEY
jgi:hypothetical protein